MSIFSRFFGKQDAGGSSDGPLVANPQITQPLSLQVIFPEPIPLDSEHLAGVCRSYHRSMSEVRCEIDAAMKLGGNVFGMVGWGKHVIRCVGFDLPVPAPALEPSVAAAHYPQALKERARTHQAHIILYYTGYDPSPLEQYVALAALAGVFARLGAIVVLNESAHTSFPAAALSGSKSDGDIMELLRSLPLLILYCGFVKHEVEGIPGVWMRTYGAPRLGLPDFAVHAEGHHEGQRYFEMLENILTYLRESGARLDAGHTMQVGEEEYLRVRLPTEEETFLQGEGELLVAEVIGMDQINGWSQRL